MNTINKKELSRLIANETDVTISGASSFLDALETVCKDALRAGNTINLNGFLKLEPGERAGRMGRNPLTGAAVEIPTKRVIKAKVSPTILSDSEGGEL